MGSARGGAGSRAVAIRTVVAAALVAGIGLVLAPPIARAADGCTTSDTSSTTTASTTASSSTTTSSSSTSSSTTSTTADTATTVPEACGPAPLGLITTAVGGLGAGLPTRVGQGPASVFVVGQRIVLTDPVSNAVRSIDLATSNETVLAGTGLRGYGGDGGQAAAATLKLSDPASFGKLLPPGIVIDSSGDVIFADTGNHVVRKVDAAGVITTIAGTGASGFSGDGGAATGATLNKPTGLALDSQGSLFIADTGNCRVRKVALATGQIATVAGNGTCSAPMSALPGSITSTAATSSPLNVPTGIVLDAAGNLFIANTFASGQQGEVDEVPVATTTGTSGMTAGRLYKVGGSTGTFERPSGLALGPGAALYVATSGTCQVQKVTPTSGVYSSAPVVVAGNATCAYGGDGGPAAAASFNTATGVAVDASGTIFVGDGIRTAGATGNLRLRQVSAAGIVSTIAGTGRIGWSGDDGPASGAQLGAPVALARNAAGDLYIADPGDNVVREARVDGTIVTVAGTGPDCLQTNACYNGDGIAATSARLNQPTGVAVDRAGNVFISDSTNCVVRKVSATTGTINTVAGTAPTLDQATSTYKIHCGSKRGTSATTSELASPAGLATDGLDNVFIADAGNNQVLQLSTSGALTVVAGTGTAGAGCADGLPTAAALDLPNAVAVGSDGSLFISDSANNQICKVTPGTNGSLLSGKATAIAGSGSFGHAGDGADATKATLAAPSGIALAADGSVFVADTANNVVREISAGGVIDTVIGTGTPGYSGDGGPAASATLDTPGAVAVDDDGNVLVADTLNGVVRKVGPGAAAVYTRLAGSDRYSTAAALARKAFPNGVTTALLATGTNFPDALAASYYAGAQEGGAPILLTARDAVPASTASVLSELHVKKVVLIGGTGAVSSAVSQWLTSHGYVVTRIAGTTRYDTMKQINESGLASVGTVDGKKTAILATGQNFPDALGAGPIAYGNRLPIVLTDGRQSALLPQAKSVLTDLGIVQVIIVGGSGAIDPGINAELDTMGVTILKQAAGSDRSATSAALATWAVGHGLATDKGMAVANGCNPAATGGATPPCFTPDALAGAPFVGSQTPSAVPILITLSPTSAEAATAYAEANSASLESVFALGGSAALADATMRDIADAAAGSAAA